MSTEQNKAVVRRFITERLDGGNVDVIDELFAPNYVNHAMGGMDVARNLSSPVRQPGVQITEVAPPSSPAG